MFKDQGIISGHRHVEISSWFGELESTFYKHPKLQHLDVFRVSDDPNEGCTGIFMSSVCVIGNRKTKSERFNVLIGPVGKQVTLLWKSLLLPHSWYNLMLLFGYLWPWWCRRSVLWWDHWLDYWGIAVQFTAAARDFFLPGFGKHPTAFSKGAGRSAVPRVKNVSS